ncbi:MAG TPA: DUF2927 domain-containing protein [Thermohalobaculum sp.]|nr:DUF2927 domain-containing protein [Thermohalobaculum sp.]
MPLPRLLLALSVALAACAAEPAPDLPDAPERAVMQPPDFPRLGAALPAGHTAYENASLARLFVVLAHETEWGAARPHLVRYEAPVSVALEGEGAGAYAPFLDGFLEELRAETGIRIARGAPANLLVRFVEGRRFDSVLRTAYCVTAQGDASWQGFAADPTGRSARALAGARSIEAMTVFIPDDAPPYLVRNCLLEEIPQALGLANDLYGLGNSSFNDDGAHLWPTKLDHLMLRVLYAPELATGLDRRTTQTQAGAVLDRVNPEGIGAPPLPLLNRRALGAWPDLMTAVFSRGVSESQTRELAAKALTVVEAHAPGSAQHCHTLVTAGRILSRREPERALRLFDRAGTVCDAAHGESDIRHARIALERACALARLGRTAEVLAIAEATWPVLAAHGQDERLAALYTIQADVLAETGPGGPQAASLARLTAEWNAYALGPGRRAADCRPDA